MTTLYITLGFLGLSVVILLALKIKRFITFITKCINYAEKIAERVIIIKDVILGNLLELSIPLPETRRCMRQRFKNLLALLSKPLSEKVDCWIETDIITVANLISFSRLPTGILLIIFKFNGLGNEYYFACLAYAGLSDYFDGVIARKMKQVTEIGGGIDAGFDKIFAICATIAFWQHFWFWPLLFFLIFDAILGGLAISLLRAKRKGLYHGEAEVKSNWLGKLKFNLQAATLLCFILGNNHTGNYFLVVANIFAFGSLIRHLEPSESKK